jgi:hypothetical protein
MCCSGFFFWIFGMSALVNGFFIPPILKAPVIIADRILTKVVDHLPLPFLRAMNVPVNSTVSLYDKVKHARLEAIAVGEMGRAFVAAYYKPSFHVANVTLDKDRPSAHVNYWSHYTLVPGMSYNADEELHRKLTVVFANFAAEVLYYETESPIDRKDNIVSLSATMHPLADATGRIVANHKFRSHFEEAYNILELHREKFKILVQMLLEDGFVDGKVIQAFLEKDVCDLEDCSF